MLREIYLGCASRRTLLDEKLGKVGRSDAVMKSLALFAKISRILRAQRRCRYVENI
jgi:hypothetical protein